MVLNIQRPNRGHLEAFGDVSRIGWQYLYGKVPGHGLHIHRSCGTGLVGLLQGDTARGRHNGHRLQWCTDHKSKVYPPTKFN